jgi:hypothetical protein
MTDMILSRSMTKVPTPARFREQMRSEVIRLSSENSLAKTFGVDWLALMALLKMRYRFLHANRY